MTPASPSDEEYTDTPLLPFAGVSAENVFDLPYADDPASRAALPPPPLPPPPPQAQLPPPPVPAPEALSEVQPPPPPAPVPQASTGTQPAPAPAPALARRQGASAAPRPADPRPEAQPAHPDFAEPAVVDDVAERVELREPRPFLPPTFSTPSTSPSTPSTSPPQGSASAAPEASPGVPQPAAVPVPRASVPPPSDLGASEPEEAAATRFSLPPPIDAQYLLGGEMPLDEPERDDRHLTADDIADHMAEESPPAIADQTPALPPMVAPGTFDPATATGPGGGRGKGSGNDPSRPSSHRRLRPHADDDPTGSDKSRRRPSILPGRRGSSTEQGPATHHLAPSATGKMGPLTMSPDAPLPPTPPPPTAAPAPGPAPAPAMGTASATALPPLIPGAASPSPPPDGRPTSGAAPRPAQVSVPGGDGPRIADGVLVGSAGAVIAGFLWWLVVALTQSQVVYVSVFLGVLVGFAVIEGTRRPSATAAGLASALTLTSLSISQYFIARSLAISELNADIPLWNGFGEALDVIRSAYTGDLVNALFVLLAAAAAGFTAWRPTARPLAPGAAPPRPTAL